MFAYKSTERLHQLAIKKQTSVCCFISNPYRVFQTWNHGKKKKKKKKKRKEILLLAYIADVSLLDQSLLLYAYIVFKY